MSPPSQVESIVSSLASLAAFAAVAAVATALTRAMFHRSIPVEERRRLEKAYGAWAVHWAESRCPENDVACVEREARRLYRVSQYRRR